MDDNCVIDMDTSVTENEDDVELDVETCRQAVLWSTDWTVETIINQMVKGKIELSPKFQRRNAWDDSRKSKFIESIILAFPIPQIILAESKDKKGLYIVIDGKQRLLSIRQFGPKSERDEFKTLTLRDLEILEDLNKKSYEALNNDPTLEEYKAAFEDQTIRTVVIKEWPSEEYLYKIFYRLNTGSLPLSPQELRQALHPGPFLDYVDEFSQSSEQIKKVLNITEPDRRMRDVELVVRYFAFKNYLQEYTGKLKLFLDESCNKLNEIYSSKETLITEQAKNLELAIECTLDIFGKGAFRKWKEGKFTTKFNKAIFDIMVYYFSEPTIRANSLKKKEEIKNAFINLCDEDVEFLRSFETSTKDLSATYKRFSVWSRKLSDILDVKIPIPEQKDGKIVIN